MQDYLERKDVADRKKEVIDGYLDHFVAKGMSDTSVRDLGESIQMQSGALYWYFSNKDDAVIACAEEAATRLETKLIIPSVKEVLDPENMINHLLIRADEIAPTMRFFVQVCSTPKYVEKVQPILNRLSRTYEFYSLKVAEALGCKQEEAESCMSVCVAAFINYMLFGDKKQISSLVKIIKRTLSDLNCNKENM